MLFYKLFDYAVPSENIPELFLLPFLKKEFSSKNQSEMRNELNCPFLIFVKIEN